MNPRLPEFADFWPVPAWRARAEALAADQPALAGDAQRLAETLVPESVVRLFVTEVERLAGEIGGVCATRLETALPTESRDRAVLLAMIARDLTWHWLRPTWRVRLSYRQLCQSRLWTRALVEAPAVPFALAVCTVEEAILGASAALIQTALDPTVRELRRRLVDQLHATGAPQADIDALALDVLVERLRATVGARIDAAYETHV